MYDKLATNPFTDRERMIIVWVEDCENETKNHDKKQT